MPHNSCSVRSRKRSFRGKSRILTWTEFVRICTTTFLSTRARLKIFCYKKRYMYLCYYSATINCNSSTVYFCGNQPAFDTHSVVCAQRVRCSPFLSLSLSRTHYSPMTIYTYERLIRFRGEPASSGARFKVFSISDSEPSLTARGQRPIIRSHLPTRTN